MADLHWDPYDIEIDTSPYETWRRLRDEAPLYRNEAFDFYALSRFDDIDRAHRDPLRFSSAHGTVLENMVPQKSTEGGTMMVMKFVLGEGLYREREDGVVRMAPTRSSTSPLPKAVL